MRNRTEKHDIHILWRNPNFSCNGRQDVKSHPNSHIFTPNHQKKDSVVNLYIQIHLGSTPKLHYLMLYTLITPCMMSKGKSSFNPNPKKKKSKTNLKKRRITLDIQLKCWFCFNLDLRVFIKKQTILFI